MWPENIRQFGLNWSAPDVVLVYECHRVQESWSPMFRLQKHCGLLRTIQRLRIHVRPVLSKLTTGGSNSYSCLQDSVCQFCHEKTHGILRTTFCEILKSGLCSLDELSIYYLAVIVIPRSNRNSPLVYALKDIVRIGPVLEATTTYWAGLHSIGSLGTIET